MSTLERLSLRLWVHPASDLGGCNNILFIVTFWWKYGQKVNLKDTVTIKQLLLKDTVTIWGNFANFVAVELQVSFDDGDWWY